MRKLSEPKYFFYEGFQKNYILVTELFFFFLE